MTWDNPTPRQAKMIEYYRLFHTLVDYAPKYTDSCISYTAGLKCITEPNQKQVDMLIKPCERDVSKIAWVRFSPEEVARIHQKMADKDNLFWHLHRTGFEKTRHEKIDCGDGRYMIPPNQFEMAYNYCLYIFDPASPKSGSRNVGFSYHIKHRSEELGYFVDANRFGYVCNGAAILAMAHLGFIMNKIRGNASFFVKEKEYLRHTPLWDTRMKAEDLLAFDLVQEDVWFKGKEDEAFDIYVRQYYPLVTRIHHINRRKVFVAMRNSYLRQQAIIMKTP
jgi:hypothetical protein